MSDHYTEALKRANRIGTEVTTCPTTILCVSCQSLVASLAKDVRELAVHATAFDTLVGEMRATDEKEARYWADFAEGLCEVKS